jgi:hypothetical protein
LKENSTVPINPPELPTDAATILGVERAVIGGVLANHGCTIPPLHVQQFFKGGHRIIWAALLNVVTTHGSVEISSLAQYLAGRNELGEIGGWEALAQIENEGTLVTSANLPGYAGQIRDSYRKREEARIGRLLNAGEIRGDEAQRRLATLADSSESPVGVAVIENLADVQAEEIKWLWENRIVRGNLSLLIGIPGLGKSMATLDLVSRITTGRGMPGDDLPFPAGNVILLSAEDASANTIKPRLEAHGADCSRVDRLRAIRDAQGEHEFSIKRDLAPLEALIREKSAVLVTIDPLNAYLGEQVKDWSDSGMRAVLSPLAALAERTGCAILGIMHLTKDTDRPAILRVPGSIANAAAARCIQAVLQDPENDGRRFLANVKNNLGPKAATLAFKIDDGPVIVWEKDPVDSVDVNAVLATKPADSYAVRQAAEFLGRIFEDKAPGEWLPAKPIEHQAEEEGISEPTLRRARKRLGILSRRQGAVGKGRGTGAWLWAKASALTEPSSHAARLNVLDSKDVLKVSPSIKESFMSKKSKKSVHEGNEGNGKGPDALSDEPSPDLFITITRPISPGDMLRLQDAMVDAEGRTMTDKRHGEPLPGQPGLFELLDVTDCGPGSTFRWADRPKLGTGSLGRRETIRYANRCVVPYTNIPATVIEVTLVGDKPRLRDVTEEYAITADDFRLKIA